MEEFLTWVLVILDLTFGIICNVLTADDEMTYLQMDNIYSDCLGPLLVIRYFEDLLIYSPEKDSLDAILCEDIRFNKLSLSPKICESLQQLKYLISLEGKCNSRQSGQAETLGISTDAKLSFLTQITKVLLPSSSL